MVDKVLEDFLVTIGFKIDKESLDQAMCEVRRMEEVLGTYLINIGARADAGTDRVALFRKCGPRGAGRTSPMTTIQYDGIIKSLLYAWFQAHGPDARIPDYSDAFVDIDDLARVHFLRLYNETRARFDQPVTTPDHIHDVVFPDRAAT